MANEVLRKQGTARTWKPSGGDEVLTLTSLANSAGRAGDLITVRNLSPGLGTAVDRLRNFRIKRKRYDVIEDVLELTPELELPDLAVMVGAVERRPSGGGKPSGFVAKEG